MEQLAGRISDAFAKVSYPGDDNLTDSTYGNEAAALVIAFRGMSDWRTLESTFLDNAPAGWSSALSFFSADAFLFYLPAYLLADIRGELEHTDPVSRLCTYVTPQAAGQKFAKVWDGGTMGEHARRAFAKFNCPQVTVIVEYLSWRLDQRGYDLTIEQALEYYWLEREAGCKQGAVSSI